MEANTDESFSFLVTRYLVYRTLSIRHFEVRKPYLLTQTPPLSFLEYWELGHELQVHGHATEKKGSLWDAERPQSRESFCDIDSRPCHSTELGCLRSDVRWG
jgi:hypothetical protein